MSEEVPSNVPDTVQDTEPDQPKRPALVIQIYSWSVPIVGLAMLLVGAFIGYLARPLITPTTGDTPVQQAQVPESSNPASQEGSPSSTPTLMEYLIGQTKHFKGNPDAPVTIIEFSDYQ